MTPTRLETHERFDARTSGCLAIDNAGAVVFFGTHAEALFGYSQAQVVGQPVEMLLHPDDRAAHPAKRDGFLTADETSRQMASEALALRGYRSDATLIDLRIRILNWRDGLRTAVLTEQPATGWSDVSDSVRLELLALDALIVARSASPAGSASLPLAQFIRRDAGKATSFREMGVGEAAASTAFVARRETRIDGFTVVMESAYRQGSLIFSARANEAEVASFAFAGPEKSDVVDLPGPIVLARNSRLELWVMASNFKPDRDEVTVVAHGY